VPEFHNPGPFYPWRRISPGRTQGSPLLITPDFTKSTISLKFTKKNLLYPKEVRVDIFWELGS
jgi:hypothetical protein